MCSAQILEAVDGISYVADLEGTMTAVGTSNWNAFASTNDALELNDQSVVGRNLFEFVSGEDLRGQLRTVLKRIAAGIHNRWVMPFGCDAPDRIRNMRLSITPIRDRGVSVGFRFQSIELNSEQRPPIDLFEFKEIEKRARREPDLPTIAMCSWCQKVRHEPTSGPSWLEAEDYYAAGGRSHVKISHSICDTCFDADCPVHDTSMQEWRHLDFFEHQAFLHARVPRVRCDDCGVKQIAVPWARSGSGFTLLFEALVMTLVTAMPLRAAARLVGEHDTRLWRILHHWVEIARDRADFAGVKRLAIDETAARRGHDYITLFVDIDQRRVLYVVDGKDAKTVEAFADDLEAHGGDAARIKEVCIDMSAAFIKGVTENLTEAEITFDKFHAVKLVNDAVDKVRRAEAKVRPELKRSRYLWLKNEHRLSAGQSAQLASLSAKNLKTARAYHLRLAFQDIYAEPSRAWGEFVLDRWYSWARRCRLEPMKEVALTIQQHRDGILRCFDSRIANGLIESINSLIQAAKAKARGYRSTRNLKAITYLIAGKLDLRLPT